MRSEETNETVRKTFPVESGLCDAPTMPHQGILRQLLASMREGVIHFDVEGRVLYCNPSAEDILGIPRSKVIGRSLVDLHWRSILENGFPLATSEHPVMVTLRTGVPHPPLIMGFLEANEVRKWLEVRTEPCFDEESHEPNTVLCFFSDITKSKNIIDRLRMSDRRLAESHRIAKMGCWSWDPAKDEIWWSDSIHELFGTDPQATPPSFEAFLDLVHPDDRPRALSRAQAMSEGSCDFAHDIRLIRPNGECIWIFSRAIAHRDREGKILLVEGTDQDITTRKLNEFALKESESRLKLALQAASSIAFVWNIPEDRVVRYFSIESALPANSDYPERLEDVRSRVYPEDLTAFDANLDHCLRNGNEYRNLYRVLRPDGKIGWLEEWGIIERYSDGTPLRLNGISMDVTERIDSEAELSRTSFLLQAVADGTTDAIFVKDHVGKYLFANQATANFFGRPIHEVVGRTDQQLFDRESAQIVSRIDQEIRENGRTQTHEEMLHIGGRSRIFQATKGPFLDKEGNIVGVIGISRDITARKEIERNLELTQFSLDHVADSIFWINMQQEFIRVNETSCRMLGYSRDELLHMNVLQIDPTCSMERFQQAIDGLRQTGVCTFETCVVKKDGTRMDVEVSQSLFMFENQEIVCAFVRDIRDRKISEERVRQAEKMDAIGRLAGGVAHDFNNLLTIINCHTALLLSESRPEDSRRDHYRAIQHAGNRASELTSQLLAFSRKANIENKLVQLNDVVEFSLSLLRGVLREDIAMDLQLARDLELIRINQGQLERILMNLAVNAMDAMKQGGTLTISTKNHRAENQSPFSPSSDDQRNFVCLEVRDTGHGMNDETKRRAFEPFFTTKEPGKGTGLGLSVVHGIINQCGGSIRIESQEGVGTSFHMLFPAATSSMSDDIPKKPKDISPESRTILVVDDEFPIQKIVRAVLESSGYKVFTESSAFAALQWLDGASHRVDVVLTDVAMPDKDGFALAKSIRKLGLKMPIIFMSGFSGLGKGSTEFVESESVLLNKPFTPKELLEVIGRCFKEKP